MSIYIEKMKELLEVNTAISIQQLESDSTTGNLEATYLLGKVYYDGIYAAPFCHSSSSSSNGNCSACLRHKQACSNKTPPISCICPWFWA